MNFASKQGLNLVRNLTNRSSRSFHFFRRCDLTPFSSECRHYPVEYYPIFGREWRMMERQMEYMDKMMDEYFYDTPFYTFDREFDGKRCRQQKCDKDAKTQEQKDKAKSCEKPEQKTSTQQQDKAQTQEKKDCKCCKEQATTSTTKAKEEQQPEDTTSFRNVYSWWPYRYEIITIKKPVEPEYNYSISKKVETQTVIKDGKQTKKTITTIVNADGTKQVNEVVEEGDYKEANPKKQIAEEVKKEEKSKEENQPKEEKKTECSEEKCAEKKEEGDKIN